MQLCKETNCKRGKCLSTLSWKEGVGVGVGVCLVWVWVCHWCGCVELDLVQEKRKEATWTNMHYYILLSSKLNHSAKKNIVF